MSRIRYVAILDSAYVTRGLVMHESLRQAASDAQLDILCMDPGARALLEELDLDGVGIVDIAELEAYDPALAAVRPERSLSEYCWTAKPSLCRFLLDRHSDAEALVYVDADLVFYADPAVVLEELRGHSVLVVPHRAPPEERWEEALGTYNAGFVAFQRGEEAIAVLNWWRERCLEWCFERVEPGRYCDQKYLDEWPKRFAHVRSLAHAGGGLAPWNAGRHTLNLRSGRIYVDEAVPLVFFHFQSLRIYRGLVPRLRRIGLMPERYRGADELGTLAWSVFTSYQVSRDHERLLYTPYARRLAAAADRVLGLRGPGDATFARVGARQLIRDATRALIPTPVGRALRWARSFPRRRRDARLSRVPP
jgi:hypothetical protein